MKLNPKQLFDGLTWMQVGAGALAAVTAFFLASTIGVTGSLIGAGVASLVSTVTSQVYKNFLTASNDAVKQKLGAADPEPISTQEPPAPDAETTGPVGAHFSSEPASATTAPDAQPAALDATAVLQPLASPTTVLPPLATVVMPVCGPSPEELELQRLEALAAQRRAERTTRRVVVVAVLSALLAVAVSAGAILLATSGDGIGYRPPAQHGQQAILTEPTAGEGAPSETEQTAQDPTANAEATAPNEDATTGEGAAEGGAAPQNPATGDESQVNRDPAAGDGSDSAGNTEGPAPDDNPATPEKAPEVESPSDNEVTAPEHEGTTPDGSGTTETPDASDPSTGTQPEDAPPDAGAPADPATPEVDAPSTPEATPTLPEGTAAPSQTNNAAASASTSDPATESSTV